MYKQIKTDEQDTNNYHKDNYFFSLCSDADI